MVKNNKRWIDEIIDAYESKGGIGHYSEIYKHIMEHTDRKLPRTYKDGIRKIVEDHSSDSKNYNQNNEDIFYSVEGLGKGIWGLRKYLRDTPKAPDINSDDFGIYGGNETPMRKKAEVYRILRDTDLSKKLKLLYKNKCQICNKVIDIKGQGYSEAHHIIPLGKGYNGPDILENIIVLCPNHHVEFDYGVITINPDTYEVIHIDKNDEYNGTKINCEYHKLKKEYLEYHLSNIFNK